MQQYHSNADDQSVPVTHDGPLQMEEMNPAVKMSRLNLKYHFSFDMVVGDLDKDPKSVQEEYTSYITQWTSPMKTDILKFWEVHRT